MVANFERTVRASALAIAVVDSEVDSVRGNFHGRQYTNYFGASNLFLSFLVSPGSNALHDRLSADL